MDSPSRILRAALVAATVLTSTRRGAADEPRRDTEPRVLSEPAEFLQIADAFDERDPLDVAISLGFQQVWKRAEIRRETLASRAARTSQTVTDSLHVAHYREQTSRLNPRVEVGLFRDLSAVLRLPIVLSNRRTLSGFAESTEKRELALTGMPDEQLFSPGFTSPTRSGIELLALGLELGVMNQWRNPNHPTINAGIEGRFSVSEPMHACGASPDGLNQGPGQVPCADPEDYNRNGFVDTTRGPDGAVLEGKFSGSRVPGISRGVTGVEVHASAGRRIKYVEPYGGIALLGEFPTRGSDFGRADTGARWNGPPLRVTMTTGLAVIPWEIRDRFQRVTLDLRFTGTYVAEGRDYSELFDALGSSDAGSLRLPNHAEYRANPDPGTSTDTPSVVDGASRRVYFTGITRTEPHGVFTWSWQASWQAGEYVKFSAGLGYAITQSHALTYDEPCIPGSRRTSATAGPCGDTTNSSGASGIPNPNYRRVLNQPGYRFTVDDSRAWDGAVNAVVMF